MKSIVPALCLVALAATTTGCPSNEELDQSVSMKLDASLRKKEKNLVRQDVHTLAGLKLSGDASRWYPAIFGGSSAADALKYLDTRVNYLLSRRVRLESRIALVPSTGKKPAEAAGDDRDQVVTMALNVGTGVYYAAAIDQAEHNLAKPRLAFKVGGATVPILGTRIGVVQLGEGYNASDFSALNRIGTLIHEARHSDCKREPNVLELALFATGQDVPSVHQCGNTHVTCPAGHPY
ncbi:MAG TPA: hypothetical protein VL588_06645, partial [Bdellovibrionota bacterium]|nr:hypothetical protein [Bdellovibrionota bacterium]